jgi:hypothetical protein
MTAFFERKGRKSFAKGAKKFFEDSSEASAKPLRPLRSKRLIEQSIVCADPPSAASYIK